MKAEDRGRKFDGRTLVVGIVRGGVLEQFEGNTYPAMRELVARNIFAVVSEEGVGSLGTTWAKWGCEVGPE
jgi:hypothetical protein